MASSGKLLVAVGLFALVALASVLSYYFAYASNGSASNGFYFAGTHADSGAQIRVQATVGDAPAVELQVLGGSANAFTLYVAKTSAATGFTLTKYTSADSAWSCTSISSSDAFSFQGSDDLVSAGKDLAAEVLANGGAPLFKVFQIYGTDGKSLVSIPYALSADKLENFGGYAATAFSTNAADFSGFKPELSAPADLVCSAAAAESNSAVVESATAPRCSSYASLYGFLIDRVYADLTATTTWCAGSATQVVCSPTVSKQDTIWFMSGTDRGMKCIHTGTGATWLAMSGSDDVVDWLRNFSVWHQAAGFTNMKVHAGFNSKFNQWKAWYETSAGTATSVKFLGHSLGGAVANVAAVSWKVKKPSVTVSIATGGAPAAFVEADCVRNNDCYGGSTYYRTECASRTWYGSCSSTRLVDQHNAIYSNIFQHRYINQNHEPWYLPDQQDQVPYLTGAVNLQHPKSSGISFNVKEVSSNSWSTSDCGVYPIIGDLNLSFSLHTGYPAYTDGARPNSY